MKNSHRNKRNQAERLNTTPPLVTKYAAKNGRGALLTHASPLVGLDLAEAEARLAAHFKGNA